MPYIETLPFIAQGAVVFLLLVMLPLFFRGGMVMLGVILELWGINPPAFLEKNL